ncbi:D-aspartate oxidase isoform X2 [Hetaerina americana]|uniref:D-aspartate oxidase isoform X2 n=1 Tax=Hetaerina americana TaxID=62018 RepID=UPI003A7F11E3
MERRGAMDVCILGAGVVGLMTALELQDQFPNANYTIIAHLFNQNTTSDGAAGLFHPSSTFTGPTLDITENWIADSYSYYDNLRNSSDGEKSGVFQCSGFQLSSSMPSLIWSNYMKKVAPVYRYATEEELKVYPGNWKYGSYCVTLGIECRRLLPWSLLRFQESGGKVISKKIESFGELADDYDVVMNCSGLSAAQLCQDRQMVPIRGQVIKVVHNYGHGGYGVTTAPGTAKHAVNLFRQLHSGCSESQPSKL